MPLQAWWRCPRLTALSAVNDATDFLPQYPLTPAMRDVLRRMARANRPHMHQLTPQQARAAYEAGAGVLEIAKIALPRVEELQIPARDGALLAARLYAPQAQAQGVGEGEGRPLPVLMYLHGGGFTVGSIDTHDQLCRSLAHQAGCAVVSLDYRLAPEWQFPTASNDAWDALQWLAASCAILARDAGLPLALQLLIYPGTTAHQDTDSHETFAHGLLLEKEGIAWFFSNYVRDDADRADWRFAPLLAPDVDGVAPAFICLAELDPLVDEGVAYADKLRMAGVAVDLEIYRGVTHEFIKMGRAIPEARQAQADAAKALKAALGAH